MIYLYGYEVALGTCRVSPPATEVASAELNYCLIPCSGLSDMQCYGVCFYTSPRALARQRCLHIGTRVSLI